MNGCTALATILPERDFAYPIGMLMERRFTVTLATLRVVGPDIIAIS
jgi:hypothetical protein